MPETHLIYLTDEQYAKLPYKNTEVSQGKTFGKIVGELKDHGIQDYRWTTYQGTDVLEFPLKVMRNEVDYPFVVKITVPKLMYPMKEKGNRSRNAPKTMTFLEQTSWRVFFWYLKSRLDAISYGITDVTEAFMYHMHYALEDGGLSQLSIGEAIMQNVENVNKLTSLPDKRERRMVDLDE